MPELSTCPCCPSTPYPAEFEEVPVPGLTAEELIYDDKKHVDVKLPTVIKRLDKDMHYDSEFVRKQLATDYGCSSAFQVLSDEGVRIMDKVIHSMEHHCVSSPRIPKVLRAGTFRSKWLNELGHSQAVLKHVSKLAGCEMIYHPMRIQQLHMNWKPDDTVENGKKRKKNIDRWHCDTTAFVLVLFCTDPSKYVGGELQYFNGNRAEGEKLLSTEGCLPADRVMNVGEQKAGYGVFMQGSRVFHQVTPVLEGNERTTMVYSFQPMNVLALEAADRLSLAYNQVDPLNIFIPDWARYRAWKVMVRLDMWRLLCGVDDKFEFKGNGISEEDKQVITSLSKVLKSVNWKLRNIVETLPYTENRALMSGLLDDAVKELREFLKNREEESKFGLENLRGGIKDIDNCIEDVMTLKENETTMQYF